MPQYSENPGAAACAHPLERSINSNSAEAWKTTGTAEWAQIHCVAGTRVQGMVEGNAWSGCKGAGYCRHARDGRRAQRDPIRSSPSMTVQAHLAKLRKLNRPGAVFFLDGISAFYAASREFLFWSSHPAAVNDWIQSLPVRACLKERLFLLMQGPALLERLGVLTSIRELLQSQFTPTWFAIVLEHARVFQSQAGTIPGSPVADILFQFIAHVALDAILATLEDSGLSVKLMTVNGNSIERAATPLPTWLDDVAVLIESTSASNVTSEVAQATAIAFESFQMIGVDLNFQPGKSEAIVHFAGQGAKAARHKTMMDDATIPVAIGDSVISLRCVRSYIHLGTAASLSSARIDDIQRRQRLIEAIFKPLSNRLLFNPSLLAREKTRLLQTMVLNKFCHGAGTWMLHTQASYKAFRAAYMGFVRRAVRPIAGFSSKFQISK